MFLFSLCAEIGGASFLSWPEFVRPKELQNCWALGFPYRSCVGQPKRQNTVIIAFAHFGITSGKVLKEPNFSGACGI